MRRRQEKKGWLKVVEKERLIEELKARISMMEKIRDKDESAPLQCRLIQPESQKMVNENIITINRYIEIDDLPNMMVALCYLDDCLKEIENYLAQINGVTDVSIQ